jgi:GNAT superfamily N-acetyltransferase
VRDDSGVPIEFRAMDAGVSPASALIAAMVDEMVALYADDAIPGPPPATAADFAPPGGTFLVGFDGDEPVCAGGLMRLSDGAAEIKRMYVVPSARRRGLARALLAVLEDAARALGYGIVRLDTGARQPHARGLYESVGYVSVPDYNGNRAAAFWGEKRL